MSGTSIGRTGRYVESVVGGEKVRAYVPSPLPPVPAVDVGQFLSLYDRARGAVPTGSLSVKLVEQFSSIKRIFLADKPVHDARGGPRGSLRFRIQDGPTSAGLLMLDEASLHEPTGQFVFFHYKFQ